MPGTTGSFTESELSQWYGEAMFRLADQGTRRIATAVNQGLIRDRITTESGGATNGVFTAAADSYKGRSSDGLRAYGAMQMFPEAFSDAYNALYGKTISKANLIATWQAELKDPKKAVMLGVALYAVIERKVRKWPELNGYSDENGLRAVITAAYHLGVGGARTVAKRSMVGGRFDLSTFVANYEARSAAVEGGHVNPAVRSAAGGAAGSLQGAGGGTSGSAAGSSTPPPATNMGPADSDASKYVSLGFDVANVVPLNPPNIITKGLSATPWWKTKAPTGNPHLRQVPVPVTFEIRLNRTNGTSLSDPQGGIVEVRLNVSLQSFRISSQHVLDRTPTATGLALTFWGMQPDTIVGRGTTGVFMNQFGLTSLMSSRGSMEALGFYDIAEEAYKNSPKEWASILSASDKFRVAAQDAFMELVALFKNNGLTRFVPRKEMEGPDKTLTDADLKAWNPSAGATGFQMLGRVGEVRQRGYVALKYRGSVYMGYFKTLNFTADAKDPHKWNFDFSFKVLQSYTPIFVKG